MTYLQILGFHGHSEWQKEYFQPNLGKMPMLHNRCSLSLIWKMTQSNQNMLHVEHTILLKEQILWDGNLKFWQSLQSFIIGLDYVCW